MKHLRKFNEDLKNPQENAPYLNPEKCELPDGNIMSPNFIENIDIKQGEKLTEQELKNLITYSQRIDNMEIIVNFLKRIKDEHSYIRSESPWKEIWIPAIKEWYEKYF